MPVCFHGLGCVRCGPDAPCVSSPRYEKMMEGSSEIGIRIKGLIEIRLKKPKKVFVVPDNIEEFDIRNYV